MKPWYLHGLQLNLLQKSKKSASITLTWQRSGSFSRYQALVPVPLRMLETDEENNNRFDYELPVLIISETNDNYSLENKAYEDYHSYRERISNQMHTKEEEIQPPTLMKLLNVRLTNRARIN